MRDVKKYSAIKILQQLETEKQFQFLNQLIFKRGNQHNKIWMDGFDDFSITNPKTFETKLNYIHENPIRKKYAGSSEDYQYSSASFYLTGEQGLVKVKHYAEVLGIPGYGAL